MSVVRSEVVSSVPSCVIDALRAKRKFEWLPNVSRLQIEFAERFARERRGKRLTRGFYLVPARATERRASE